MDRQNKVSRPCADALIEEKHMNIPSKPYTNDDILKFAATHVSDADNDVHLLLGSTSSGLPEIHYLIPGRKQEGYEEYIGSFAFIPLRDLPDPSREDVVKKRIVEAAARMQHLFQTQIHNRFGDKSRSSLQEQWLFQDMIQNPGVSLAEVRQHASTYAIPPEELEKSGGIVEQGFLHNIIRLPPELQVAAIESDSLYLGTRKIKPIRKVDEKAMLPLGRHERSEPESDWHFTAGRPAMSVNVWNINDPDKFEYFAHELIHDIDRRAVHDNKKKYDGMDYLSDHPSWKAVTQKSTQSALGAEPFIYKRLKSYPKHQQAIEALAVVGQGYCYLYHECGQDKEKALAQLRKTHPILAPAFEEVILPEIEAYSQQLYDNKHHKKQKPGAIILAPHRGEGFLEERVIASAARLS